MDKTGDNQKSYILLLDDLNQARNKIKSAITDSDGKIIYDPKHKAGISNLLTIYASLTDRTIKDIEKQYKDANYQTFKADLAEIVVETLKPIQMRYQAIINSPELDLVLDQGRNAASFIAKRKLAKVYQKLGIGRQKK